MRVLFVDDERGRVGTLRSLASDAGIPVGVVFRPTAESVTEADVEAADVLFLDHDMCATGFGEQCPVTKSQRGCGCPNGKDMVKRLVEWGIRRPVVVHSANTKMGDRMAHYLRRRGWSVEREPISRWYWFTPESLAARFWLSEVDQSEAAS